DGVKHWDVFLNAHDGSVVEAFDSLHTAAANLTGNTMWVGTVSMPGFQTTSGLYVLLNPAESNLTTRNMQHNTGSGTGVYMTSTTSTFGNGDKANTDPNTAGADAHFGATKTWEYYKNTFGRNGIDNAGRSTYNRVHYDVGYENAFWDDSCFCMTYGDGSSTFY